MKNQAQLICYVDRFGGGALPDLHAYLQSKLAPYFSGGVHLLPFFSPIDGADAGYDPINHQEVDKRLGNWNDVKGLSQNFDLTADLIVNHISDKSKEFKDVDVNGKSSTYFELFLTKDKVFPEGADVEDINKIYRPRPNRPFSVRKLQNGESYEFWSTFSRSQLDIDINSTAGEKYLQGLVEKFSSSGVKMIRLDAVGYAIKKAGTSCFMLPETYDYIKKLTDNIHKLGMEVLAEVHAHYEVQIEIAKCVDYVYDFALPPLILFSLFTKNATRLKQWYSISPRNCLTVLDTHDGIGVMDVASYNGKPGILSNEELDQLVEGIHEKSKHTSKQATGEAASNLDLYQVNCSFYDALGQSDQMYLMARAIQFFSPGIPQVYYGGLLAAENDMDLLASTKVGRDINRPYFQFEEIDKALEKTVVKQLLNLLYFRNNHESFNGNFQVMDYGDEHLHLRWVKAEHWSELNINLPKMEMTILFSEDENTYSVGN
jgi:sucrose phosphorylase